MTRTTTTTRSRLSRQQRDCLDLLRAVRHGAGLNPPALGILLDTSPQGAAATASSLVVRGLVERYRSHGHVFYRATDEGRERHDG